MRGPQTRREGSDALDAGVLTAPVSEARRHREAAGANDAVAYCEGIMAREPETLVRSFAGEPRAKDPRVGYVEGARQLRAFVNGTADWLREGDAVVENLALTHTPTRTVEKVVLRLLADDGKRVELPVAIVTDRNSDRTLKVIRVYHSMWPLTGEHRMRSPLLAACTRRGRRTTTSGRWPRASWKASWRPSSPAATPASRAAGRTSTAALQEVYAHLFAHGGGIPLKRCTLTDDGVRWGVTDILPQAGVAVYERGSSGLLAAARIYDEVEPQAVSDTSAA